MSSYNFPMREIGDLVSIFSHWKLECTDSDFRQPKRDKWQHIFTSLLCFGLGVDESDMLHRLYQTQFAEVNSVTFPKLHEDSMPLFNLLKAMQRVLYSCGVEDFNVQDIVDPKPRRLVRICSALINFIEFRGDRMVAYERIKEADDALKDQRQLLLSSNDELKRKINDLRASRAEQEPQIKKFDEEIQVLNTKFDTTRKSATAIQKRTADAKTELAERKAHLCKLKQSIATAKEEGARLGNQIVHSPERMKGEAERMKGVLRQKAQLKQDKLPKIVELNSKISAMQLQDSVSDQALALIKAVSENVAKQKELSADIDKVHEQVSLRREHIRKATTREQQMKRIIGTKQEKMAKLKLHHDNKAASYQERLLLLNDEKQKLLSEQGAEELEVQNVEEARERLLEQDLRRLKEHEDTMTTLKEKYAELLMQVDIYHKALGTVTSHLTSK